MFFKLIDAHEKMRTAIIRIVGYAISRTSYHYFLTAFLKGIAYREFSGPTCVLTGIQNVENYCSTFAEHLLHRI